MILYNSVEDIASNFFTKQKESLTQEEQKEFSTLQNTLIEIETEYKDKIEKFFFVSKTADFSSVKFDKLNKVFLDKFQKLREQTKSEKNLQYLELCIKANFAIKDTLQNELNNFLNNPLDNAIYSHLRFKQEIQKRNLTQTEAIAELKKLLAEKLKAEFEADFLEKCSCYQNNIINNLLKIIGASTNSKTNKKESPKTKKLTKEIKVEEKDNRLYISTEIKKGEIFKLSIDKEKEITPAMFKYYIYFLKIATQHIKPIYNNGNMKEMQFIIINLDEASEELGIRKDKLKNIFIEIFGNLQTVKIEKGNYFANAPKGISKGERYISFEAKLINGFTVYKNKIEVCLNETFTISLINSQEMIIPLLLFRVNQNQYPLSFIIGYFLLLHERRTQKGRNYNDFIYLDIETLLNNSGKDIENIIKNKHSPREKGLFINNIQYLVNIGLLKEYKYKLNGKLYDSNTIEDNTTFTQWRKYTLAYKFTDEIVEECLKPYNKPIPKPKKSKIVK